MLRILILAMALAVGTTAHAAKSKKKQADDPCWFYNVGTTIGMSKEEEAEHWITAVKESKKLVGDLRRHAMGWGTGRDPYLHTRAEQKVRELVGHHVTRAQELGCFSGSFLESGLKPVQTSLDEYRPTTEHFAKWDAQVEKEREDELRAKERAEAFEAFAAGAGAFEQKGGYRVSVVEAKTGVDQMTRITVRIENTSEGRILRPVTGALWGYNERSPDLGGIACVGFELTDDYGNEYPVQECEKKLRSTDPGLQPGASVQTKITFSGVPPEVVKELRLLVFKYAVAAPKDFTIRIPRELVTLSLKK